ncbi:MAG: ATP-binding protein [Candidatus Rokubacteria bacterium]|nr:ATP-binding protein [Candidatus Rokubacteria bacterium]
MHEEHRAAAGVPDERVALRRRIAELEALEARHQEAEAKLARLASFPEQNPNAVIETDAAGRVTYLNPVAQAQFPELWREGFAHPILRGVEAILAGFQSGERAYVAREIESGNAIYEEKICYTREDDVVRLRVYVHDITRRKLAEAAIQKLAKRVVFAQEAERHRISRELHDEAGQALTALKLSLELLMADLPSDTDVLRQNLHEAVALTDTTRERIRSLARGLRPPALDTLGLNLTLEAFCRDFARRTQLAVQYEGAEVEGLSDAMTIALYRVLQEALTNVVRHAQATGVEVRLVHDARTVQLIVADNGRGFDGSMESAVPGGELAGIGLQGIQERLELFGGRLEVASSPGRGTRLLVHLPLEERA